MSANFRVKLFLLNLGDKKNVVTEKLIENEIPFGKN